MRGEQRPERRRLLTRLGLGIEGQPELPMNQHLAEFGRDRPIVRWLDARRRLPRGFDLG